MPENVLERRPRLRVPPYEAIRWLTRHPGAVVAGILVALWTAEWWPYIALVGICWMLLRGTLVTVPRRRAGRRERERQAHLERMGPWRARPDWARKPPRESQQKWARHTIRRLDPGYGELLDAVAPLGQPLSSQVEWRRVMPRRPRPPKGPDGGSGPGWNTRPPRVTSPPPLPPTSTGKLDPSKPLSEQLKTLMRWHLEQAETVLGPFEHDGTHITVDASQGRTYRAHVAECQRLKAAIQEAEAAELRERNAAALRAESRVAMSIEAPVWGTLTNLRPVLAPEPDHPPCPACGMSGDRVEQVWASMKGGDLDVWRCGLGHRWAMTPPPDTLQPTRPSSVDRITR